MTTTTKHTPLFGALGLVASMCGACDLATVGIHRPLPTASADGSRTRSEKPPLDPSAQDEDDFAESDPCKPRRSADGVPSLNQKI